MPNDINMVGGQDLFAHNPNIQTARRERKELNELQYQKEHGQPLSDKEEARLTELENKYHSTKDPFSTTANGAGNLGNGVSVFNDPKLKQAFSYFITVCITWKITVSVQTHIRLNPPFSKK